MPIRKYATAEILEVKSSNEQLPVSSDESPAEGLVRFAKLNAANENDGYLYVRCRAISSRVNKNSDGWPAEELKKAYKSFLHKPIFVDHNNDDPSRTRGVIISSQLHVEDDKTSALDPYYATAPDNHKPPTWIELLLEVDAQSFPKLADAIRAGDIDAVSMGCNVSHTDCSVCGNTATDATQFCEHIQKKGLTFEITSENGETIKKKAYEDCYGVQFFEISFVFDPADETALISEKEGRVKEAAAEKSKIAAEFDDLINSLMGPAEETNKNYIPQTDKPTAPQKVDTLRDDTQCPKCKASELERDPDGIMRCQTCGYVVPPEPLNNPDLSESGQPEAEAPGAETNEEEETVTFSAYKHDTSDEGINGMLVKTKLRTTSKERADKVLPAKEAAVEETTAGFVAGVHAGTVAALAGLGTVTITWLALEGKEVALDRKGRERKVPPGAKLTFPPMGPGQAMAMDSLSLVAMGEGARREDIPIRVEADDEIIGQVIETIHSGGMGAMRGPGVEAPAGPVASLTPQPPKRPLVPASEKNQDTPKNEKVLTDQHAPVESSVEETEPEAEQEAAKEPVVKTVAHTDEPTDEPTETVQAPVEATAEPQAPAVDPESKLLAIFALAERAEELGVIEHDNKMAYIASLEGESMEQIEARSKMLSEVKEAGLSKNAHAPGKLASIQRVPRLSHTLAATATTAESFLSDVPDEALFA